MKMMFPTIMKCCETLKEVLDKLVKNGETIEVKEIAAGFRTDVISSCAFRIEANSLKNPDSIFKKMKARLFTSSTLRNIRRIIILFIPTFAETIRIKHDEELTKFFLRSVKETMNYREKNSCKRDDFIQLLIQLINKGKLDDNDDNDAEKANVSDEVNKITVEEATGEVFAFWLGGFETSATTIKFALYELSLHPEIQEKTRAGILRTLVEYDNKITYKSIFEMEYLGRVIDETLRKHLVLPLLRKECTENYQIPNTDVIIPAGTQVHIPLLAMQNDSDIFPNPERFDPDRFKENEKSKRNHYTYLPFGVGPRICIGARFSLMQTRVGLITLLSNYRFELAKETQIPLKLDPKLLTLSPEKGMNLKVTAL